MKKENLKLKREKLEAEKSILIRCTTNLGFFTRLVTRTIPMIKSEFPEYVSLWTKKIEKDNYIKEINKELTNAFLAIWQHSFKDKNISLRKELVQLLQIVRGPRFQFGASLLERVIPKLKELYVKHIAIPHKYPFANLALKVIELEKVKQSNNSLACLHQNESLLGICSVCLEKCHPFYQTSRIWFQLGHRKFPSNLKIDLPRKSPLKRRELHRRIYLTKHTGEKRANRPLSKRLKAFNYRIELNELRKAFIPQAQATLNTSLKKHQANAESSVETMWNELEILEACWQHKNENVLRKRWPRLYGHHQEIGLLGHNTYNHFLLIAQAEEFALLDQSNHRSSFLKRNHFQTYIENISQELIITNAPAYNPEVSEETSKMLRSPLEGSDETIFCDWYEAWKKENAKLAPHQRTQDKAIRALKTKKIKMERVYEDSTYKTWIRKFNKRKKRQNKEPKR